MIIQCDSLTKNVHRIRRLAPDVEEVADAVALLKSAKRPMIIAGGGVQYSGAVAEIDGLCRSARVSQ